MAGRRPVPTRPLVHYAELSKLVSRLKIPVHWHVKRMSNPQGPEGRLLKLRKTVTALFKYERLELNWYLGDESRGYAERLISEAVKHGPQCPETMEMADWWLEEKQLVHKLFKVLVPRYQYFPTSYTNLYTAPYWYFADGFKPQLRDEYIDREINESIPAHQTVVMKKAVLELKGHPYPPIQRTNMSNPRFIQNVLLSSAKDYFKSQPGRGSGGLQSPIEEEEAPHPDDEPTPASSVESKK